MNGDEEPLDLTVVSDLPPEALPPRRLRPTPWSAPFMTQHELDEIDRVWAITHELGSR